MIMNIVYLLDYLRFPRTVKQIAVKFGVTVSFVEKRIARFQRTALLSSGFVTIGRIDNRGKVTKYYKTLLHSGVKNLNY